MSNNIGTYTCRLRLRQDTKFNWETDNPILAMGEPVLEVDTGRIKIGNGVATYTLLPYYFNETELIQKVIDTIYPINSVHITIDDVNPSSVLGGAWEKDETITANIDAFAWKRVSINHDLIVSSTNCVVEVKDSNGEVIVPSGDVLVEGGTYTITVTVDTGYTLGTIYVNNVSFENGGSIQCDGDITIEATATQDVTE